METSALIEWEENAEPRSATWRSEAGVTPPKRVIVANDSLRADAAFRLASEGTALLWRGDYHNARQLLQAMGRRAESKARKPVASPLEAFNQHRQIQSQRARTLGMLLIPFEADYTIPLRRAPDVKLACAEVWGAASQPCVASLRELQGLIGGHEWHKKGVEIAVLGARIHPSYGVFSPLRGEYLQLIANTPLPATNLAFDIGTGSGVIAAHLAQRGVAHIVATDLDPRALQCAQANLDRLGYAAQVEVLQADLFPPGRAPLIVCNPPWIPARPSSPIEHAIFDPEHQMLRGFLNGLAAHLTPAGEGWLIMSDLAEHLGLRSPSALLDMIEAAGLQVLGRSDIRPLHPKANDPSDPLHQARAAELTSLWRLGARSAK